MEVDWMERRRLLSQYERPGVLLGLRRGQSARTPEREPNDPGDGQGAES
jgi:hypothetical protein